MSLFNVSDKQNLLKALNAFQKDIHSIPKDKKNPFHKSMYVSFEQLVNVVKPFLDKHDLVFFHSGDVHDEGKFVCKTILVHVPSGEFLTSYFLCEYKDPEPQKVGSAWTYARRYGLMGILGLISEDDDGNANVKKKDNPYAFKSVDAEIDEDPHLRTLADNAAKDDVYRKPSGKWAKKSLQEICKEFGPKAIEEEVLRLEKEAEKRGMQIDPNGPVGTFIVKSEEFLADFYSRQEPLDFINAPR